MTGRILIAGGSGAIGRHLILYLKNNGCEVSVLSRKRGIADGKNTFYWDIEKGIIDTSCFEGVSHIIQFTGANISEKRWSQKRRAEIINSRTASTNLLFNAVKSNDIEINSFISASAVGYYGAITTSHIFSEADGPGSDFLSDVCIKWEAAVRQFSDIGVRTVMVRTGIVLMRYDGFLAKLLFAAKCGLGATFGNGEQYIPWIHINDLCGIYNKAVSDVSISGPYNAVAPAETTNRQFTDALFRVLHRQGIIWSIHPALLRLALGELAESLINGSRISAEKIIQTGFEYQYNDPEKAIGSLLMGEEKHS